MVGAMVGDSVGEVGALLGITVGAFVGDMVGDADGGGVGAMVGISVTGATPKLKHWQLVSGLVWLASAAGCSSQKLLRDLNSIAPQSARLAHAAWQSRSVVMKM
jgi:hypothetical protein